MIVHSIPKRLKLSAFTLLLCIPLIALEIAIVTRSPIWRLPHRLMAFWSLAFALIIIPLSIWISTIKRWAYSITVALSALWLIASGWISIQSQLPSLAFFTIFLLAFLMFELLWLRIELQRSFVHPQMAWYQALPKPIPELTCSLELPDSNSNLNSSFRVSRIDSDGIFIFNPSWVSENKQSLYILFEERRLEMKLKFKDHTITCEGLPILSLKSGVGGGIQFSHFTLDREKQMGDFIERLRGHGYV